MFGYNNINPQQVQRRLNYMEQQYPQYGNQYGNMNVNVGMQQQFIPLKGRVVTGIEEVKASPIDMDGSVHFFPDSSNGRIYTKQLNMDGTASIDVYEKVNINEQKKNDSDYVTREEYNAIVNNLNNVNSILNGFLGGIGYAQSNANDDGSNARKNEPTTDDDANVSTEPDVQSSSKNGTRKR